MIRRIALTSDIDVPRTYMAAWRATTAAQPSPKASPSPS